MKYIAKVNGKTYEVEVERADRGYAPIPRSTYTGEAEPAKAAPAPAPTPAPAPAQPQPRPRPQPQPQPRQQQVILRLTARCQAVCLRLWPEKGSP